jgi:sugar phosphate isomerase/epimerase
MAETFSCVFWLGFPKFIIGKAAQKMKYRDVTGDGGKINLDFGEMALSGKELLQMVRKWRERLG